MPIYFRNTPVSEPFCFDSIGNNWVQEPTSRLKGYPHYHYLQTEDGAGEIHILGKSYLLSPFEGILIAPFIPHSYSSAQKQWKTSFFTFTGTLESSISRILDNRQVILVEKEQGQQISSLIDGIVKKFETLPADTKSLSVDCYSLLMHFANGMYSRDLTNQPLYKQYVKPVLKKIETDYDTCLTIQSLSSQVYITPQYLSRLFRRYLGCSAYEYLTAYRINKAKEYLLTCMSMEVQEIAARTGFQDTSHFIVMFKKTTGVTPLEFRNTH